jgi:hypothetical protein
MTATIQAQSNVEQQLQQLAQRSPRFIAIAVTRATVDAWKETRNKASRVFDQPRPITKNAPRYQIATENNLTGSVYIQDQGDRGVAPEKFLSTQVEGGRTHDKPHERKLREMGILPSGYNTVPSNNSKRPRDAGGALPGPQYTRILSDLQAFNSSRFTMNRNNNTRAKFFAISTPNDPTGMPMGVYRFGGGTGPQRSVQYLAFVRVRSYTKRYDFEEIAMHKASTALPAQIQRSMDQAFNR